MRPNFWAYFGSRQTVPGRTLNLGRNAAKRAHRAGKPRKQWRRVA
jgi:hypothetical protein